MSWSFFKVTALVAVVICCSKTVVAEPIFSESFSDDSWSDRWVYSTHPGKEFGKFISSHGAFYNDPEHDKGIKTSEDARFYGLSTKFDPKSNKDKPLVIQFSVKHEQNIDCGGGYVKVFDCSLDPKDLHGESPYKIMFGPDICGPGTKKVHVIINYKDKNIAVNKDIRCKDDIYTHYYTLIVKPDNTYEVLIDNEKVESGNLEDDFNFLPPKKIKDPTASKPDDWDDRATIPDPEDTKPEDWDQPEHIPDTDATKPEDWDDEMDGNWDPPMKDNPDFKGEWKPKQIDNPNYKGVWKHPEIDNPEYTADSELYYIENVCGVGFDLWQVKAGTIFDNLLITDDPEEAKKAAEVWKATFDGEKKMKEAQDEEERKKEEASKPAEKDEDDEDEEDEEIAEKPETGEEAHDEL